MKNQPISILKLMIWLSSSLLLTACLSSGTKQANESYVPKQASLEGIILNTPDKANVELALLALDEQNRPKELLAVERYKGNGNTLSFHLNFDINKARQFKAVELRGRVSQTGKLLGYLSPWHKEQVNDNDLKGIILEFAN